MNQSKSLFCTFLLIAFSFVTFSCSSQNPIRSTNYAYSPPPQLYDELKTSSLTSVQMDSTKIVELTKLILADKFPNIHSLLIAKDNQLVYESYFAGEDQISGKKLGYIEHNREDLHDCRSISKSIVSACMGIAIQQGLVPSIDEPIYNYFPDCPNAKDSLHKKITIRHLLTMSSGLDWNENISYADFRNSELRMDISFNPIKYILGQEVVTEPGKVWNYNGGGTQILAEIIKKVSGLPIDKFAEKYLFAPLGIKKYTWTALIMSKNPAAASGLRLTSRDFIKLGLLYLNDGKWNGKQLLDSAWVANSLQSKIARPNNKGGYGYQFWTYTDTIHKQFFDITEAKGNGGQGIFICKKLNLVVVTTAGNYNKWDIVNTPHKALVDYVIPAINKMQ